MAAFFSSIVITPDASRHERLEEITRAFPGVPCSVGLPEKAVPGVLVLDLNRGRFLKPCPGQKGNVCCGYYVVEWGMGCPYQCQYCVLQYYTPPRSMVWYLNWERLIDEIDLLRRQTTGVLRIGTGEFGDSLALEDKIPLNAFLAGHLSRWENVFLEVKSKRGGFAHLDTWPNRDRIIQAFSLNPDPLIARFEKGTASLATRIRAAKQAAEAGFQLAFHLDPILPVPGWEGLYERLVEQMTETFGARKIAWISLGIFRFPRGFEDRVRESYPDTSLFFEEWYPCGDGKMRMFRPLREEIYRQCLGRLRSAFPATKVYLCMESTAVWERLQEQTPLGVSTSAGLKEALDQVFSGD